MNSEQLAGLVMFCAVTLFTPGPNNIMLMTSALNNGVARTVPHLLGVALGFAIMVLLVGVGLGALFVTWPVLHAILKYAVAAYLLILAWQIAVSVPMEEGEGARGQPMGFFAAAAFQWINPKAWVMAVGAISTYAAVAPFPWNVTVMTVLFGLGGILSSGAWVAFGSALRRLLCNARAVRAFNIAMALGLVASLYPILSE